MDHPDSPLGKTTSYDLPYDPGLLFPIARAESRARIGLEQTLPFSGWDLWNAWELSWLDPHGKPRIAWGQFVVPADSPNLIESKSLKLYLNSLNQTRFADLTVVAELIAADLTACAGAEVEVALYEPDEWPQVVSQPAGYCLDDLPVAIDRYEPAPELLRADDTRLVHEQLFSRLLRSRCPVTGQPDWGTVEIDYEGPALDRAGLLAYLVSYRLHQDFHEQCVERIFLELLRHCRPARLTVHARYLRRGGLDINPWRSNAPSAATAPLPRGRLFRQ
ncbi:MAG: NADPH-dependent 7-cyano-7-deazaguanine reductase QueF [Spongiibacteraceae bacterium]|jgi:7-cyano-7-deazaguanine reductase|nr:NADPH-dependent 7-cyano-7-deazaguanine reductase QueF [Spongiibacteraceae bacterium]